jgi:hypothetical protein
MMTCNVLADKSCKSFRFIGRYLQQQLLYFFLEKGFTVAVNKTPALFSLTFPNPTPVNGNFTYGMAPNETTGLS